MTSIEEERGAEESPAQTSPSNPPSASEANATSPPAAAPASGPDSAAEASPTSAEGDAAGRRKILIGSQRDPAAYLARHKRDWTPIEGEGAEGAEKKEGHHRRHRGGKGRHGGRDQGAGSGEQGAGSKEQQAPRAERNEVRGAPAVDSKPAAAESATPPADLAKPQAEVAAPARVAPPAPRATAPAELPPVEPLPEVVIRRPSADDDNTPVIPGRRQKLSPAMQAELDEALEGVSFEDMMSGAKGADEEGVLEPESKHRVRVVALRRNDVFVEFSGREQGCVANLSFETVPKVGDEIEVIVQRFNAEEGLYDLSLPGKSVDVGNWDDVREGMLVDVQITGHNTGGLECEVNHIRGFIPVSQISLYRVEDLAQFVGQRFTCIITDANRERKNLVLSRRAVLEREKEEKKEQFFSSLAIGQIHDGTVRKLMDFGAFVELGNGIDGLLHVSQLSWTRVKHPSEVLQEGQPIRVRIEKIDAETGRIGLSYRDMLENPWSAAASKFPPQTIAHGKVTRLMDFGAFVELEPGVEGLVHISELSPKRVWRTSDVVKEGDEVDVLVLKVDTEAQRMSLSIRALHKPEPTKKEKEEAEEAALPTASKKPQQPTGPLKGGLGKTAGGESFGLKW